MPVATLPTLLVFEVSNAITAASGALHFPIGPTLRSEVSDAILFALKVLNCFQ